MPLKHQLSVADELYVGGLYDEVLYAANERKGIRMTVLHKALLGTPAVADADHIINDATGTELPNAETVTYTTADDGSSPFDEAATPAPADVVMADGVTYNVWTLDVPRNLVAVTTHGSSVVAMTIVVNGFDVYGHRMTEQIDVAATGTSQTDNGLKAFKHIYSIAITAAGDAEANTLTLGTGDVLGLPFRIEEKDDLVQLLFDGAAETAHVVVAADDTTPTATTGDVRGTVNPNGTLNGSKRVVALIAADMDGTRDSLLGKTQYENF